MSKKIKKKNGKKVNKKKNSKLGNCISCGDRVADISIAYDGNGNNIGLLVSTGTAINTGVKFDFNVIITKEALRCEDICMVMLDMLKKGKYILCENRDIAEYVYEIKSVAFSQGIKLGEIFVKPKNNIPGGIEKNNIKEASI